jgi:hypothetical protein
MVWFSYRVTQEHHICPDSVIKLPKNTSNCKYEQGNKKLFISQISIHNNLHSLLSENKMFTNYVHSYSKLEAPSDKHNR